MADSYLNNLLASGEVLLIETRQHWVAAIRYVLRPLVILLIAAGLVLLNGLLDFGDGFLGFINDLVTWIAAILIIVSIVWLPIDLVRWWSLRYVLTSRRVMRMDGVLRKRSFDSSLEQINDIRTEQSFLGRRLGYADLTIYTASDTANEVYAQLLDGLQFKKAVLEAKEAIRTGTLLQALPEGFIVKGGTNEASMRADGKIQAQEAGVEPGASGADVERAGTTAAAAIAASTVIEPSGEVPAAVEIAPAMESVVEAVPAPVLLVEPVAEAALAVEAVAEPLVAPEPEPEPQAVAVREPVVEPEPEAEAVREPEPDAEPEPEPVLAREPEPEAEPAVETEAQAVREPVVEPEPEAEPADDRSA